MNYHGNLKDEIRRRWGKRARSYDNSPGHGVHSDMEKKAWQDILSQALDNRKELNVLDLGTGTGALALLLSDLGHTVTGIDLSKRMLKQAEEKARAWGLEVTFKEGDAEEPPFEPESFDALVSRHVLWTLPNPENAVKNWARLLKPGGNLAIIDGNFSRKNRTAFQEMWRFMAMPLILMTEFRDPRWSRDLDAHLPMRQRQRPESDLSLLEAEGLEASVSNEIIPRKYSFLRYVKYGYGHHNTHQFVVKGVKAA